MYDKNGKRYHTCFLLFVTKIFNKNYYCNTIYDLFMHLTNVKRSAILHDQRLRCACTLFIFLNKIQTLLNITI